VPQDFDFRFFSWISFPQTTSVVDTVVDLDLQISPGIFEKIRKDHNVIFRGSGKMNPEKTGTKKFRDTVPLNELKKKGMHSARTRSAAKTY
jgi:hypothetical protein